jgi:acetyl-CoA acetyltransferase
VEPFRLFDCCMENDGAAALVLMSAERARALRRPPVFLLGVAQGSEHRNAARGHNAPTYATSSFTTVAPRLWAMAGLGPKDVDVVQSYENFTGGVLMSLVEHGFFAPEEANDFLTLENLIAPAGRLPLNTSGGNLAECYMHGLELQIEAVRQLRGESPNQVPGARAALVISGPMVTPVSSMLLGTEAMV